MARQRNAENSGKQRRKGKVRGRPFRPGQSGNPGGRPKVIGHVRDLARAHTELAITKLAAIVMRCRDPRAQVAAAKELLDRAWGKAPADVHVSGGLALEAQAILDALRLTPLERRRRAQELAGADDGGTAGGA